MLQKIDTRTAEFTIDEANVLWIRIRDNAEIDREDAADNLLVIKSLTGNAPALKILDSRNTWKMTRGKKTILKEPLHGRLL